jgi:hypothetical protein
MTLYSFFSLMGFSMDKIELLKAYIRNGNIAFKKIKIDSRDEGVRAKNLRERFWASQRATSI